MLHDNYEPVKSAMPLKKIPAKKLRLASRSSLEHGNSLVEQLLELSSPTEMSARKKPCQLFCW